MHGSTLSVGLCLGYRARGVCVVDWRAAPARNLLTYLAVQGFLEKVDY